MDTTTLLVECPYDKNQITVYVKHSNKQNPTKNLRQDDVALFQNAFRKISGSIDIVCQVYIKDKDFHSIQVIGRIDRHGYAFPEDPVKTVSICDVPSSAVMRNRICLDVSIVDIHMIKIKYICDICGGTIGITKK